MEFSAKRSLGNYQQKRGLAWQVGIHAWPVCMHWRAPWLITHRADQLNTLRPNFVQLALCPHLCCKYILCFSTVHWCCWYAHISTVRAAESATASAFCTLILSLRRGVPCLFRVRKLVHMRQTMPRVLISCGSLSYLGGRRLVSIYWHRAHQCFVFTSNHIFNAICHFLQFHSFCSGFYWDWHMPELSLMSAKVRDCVVCSQSRWQSMNMTS